MALCLGAASTRARGRHTLMVVLVISLSIFVAPAAVSAGGRDIPHGVHNIRPDTVQTTAETPVVIDVMANDLLSQIVFFANSNYPGINRVCIRQPLFSGDECDTCEDLDGTSDESYGVAAGDVNGDGLVDAVFANYNQANRVCLDSRAGGFACQDVSGDAFASRSVALGDVNGDGDLDAVFANYNQANRVCLGDGAGSFACQNVSLDAFNGTGAALGDVNGDGDLDAIFSNQDEANRVCLGNGAGVFVCQDVEAAANDSRGVALGDLNGDGDLDAVFANSEQQNRACLGDGTGGFTCLSFGDADKDDLGVALGDVDGDGDLDAVTATQTPRMVACLGNGAGGLTCQDINMTALSLALADFNKDGLSDMVLGCDGKNNAYQSYNNQAFYFSTIVDDIYYETTGTALAEERFTLSLAYAPSNGSAQVNQDNTITYTPRSGFTGLDTFQYAVDQTAADVEVWVGVSPVSLGVTLTGGGMGRVTSDPGTLDCTTSCSESFVPGIDITLSAAPNKPGSAFDGWTVAPASSGADCPGNGDCLLTMDQAYTVTAAFNPDLDHDGISDLIEDAGPNNGDGNNDGLADSGQAHVATARDIYGGWITLAAPSGTELIGVTLLDTPSIGDAPEDRSFPSGFFSYNLQGLSPGAAADVLLILHEPDDGLTLYYKYGPAPNNPLDHWYLFDYDGETGAETAYDGDALVYTLHLVDGGRGDDDLTENGVIVDPGAPARDESDDEPSPSSPSGGGGGGGGCFIEQLLDASAGEVNP